MRSAGGGLPASPAPRVGSNGAQPTPVIISWSGGKDSALALERLRAQPERYDVRGLLTTVTETYDRISMHGVRRELLHEQASALGLPLREVFIPPACSNEIYETRMIDALAHPDLADVPLVAFGDLFLEDVRAYRERLMARAGKQPIFPLWGADTRALAQAFIDSGYRAVLVCVDPRQIDASFAGRAYDAALLAELPASADPCGERGEFHTFVWDGPGFERPVQVCLGERVEREGFVFADIVTTGTRARLSERSH